MGGCAGPGGQGRGLVVSEHMGHWVRAVMGRGRVGPDRGLLGQGRERVGPENVPVGPGHWHQQDSGHRQQTGDTISTPLTLMLGPLVVNKAFYCF